MTSRDELISNIRYNEYRAENIRSNISRLNNQMDELERLRSKLTNLKNQFEERQSTRRSRLNGLLSIYLATSIFAKYCEGMNLLLSGSEFQNAYGGIESALERVHQQIRELADQIDNLESDYYTCLRNADYWRDELNNYQEEEEL